MKAELIAADQERDLAIIHVTGLSSARTNRLRRPAKPVETMVFAFRLPARRALDGKARPLRLAVASSLRMDDDGELKYVRSTRAEPGNSGGPIVDPKAPIGIVVLIPRARSQPRFPAELSS